MPFSARLTLPLWPTLLVLAMLVLTVNLGFWQLRREAEKLELEQMRSLASVRPPVPLSEALQAAEPQSLSVQVGGQWLSSPAFRLANQSWNGRRGVHLLQWLQLPSGQRLLVDRGWLAAEVATTALPLATGTAELRGQLYRPGQPWRAPVLDWSQPVVELPVLDLALLSRHPPQASAMTAATLPTDVPAKIDSDQTELSPLPYLLRLDAQDDQVLQANWSSAGMTPAKHRGYAVTWFSLSAALLLLYGGWLWQQQRART